MKNYNKYLPKFYYDSVFEIPYDVFFQKGIKALFFDLDNTLLAPQEKKFNLPTQKLLKKINKVFLIVVISNASEKKLKKVLGLNFSYIYLKFSQKKPSAYGFVQALKLVNLDAQQVVMIGDQLTTDIAGANKMNIISILVKPLDKAKEHWFTKLKRWFIENPFIKKIKKENPLIYQSKFQNFVK